MHAHDILAHQHYKVHPPQIWLEILQRPLRRGKRANLQTLFERENSKTYLLNNPTFEQENNCNAHYITEDHYYLQYNNNNNIVVKWYMKCFIYWTVDLKSCKLWSSQLWMQFKQMLNIWNISYITSHSFLTGSLELTNDQLPMSVAS